MAAAERCRETVQYLTRLGRDARWSFLGRGGMVHGQCGGVTGLVERCAWMKLALSKVEEDPQGPVIFVCG